MELPDVPLFRGLTADEAEAAVTALRMHRRAFAKGEILLEAGQRAPALGVVLAGPLGLPVALAAALGYAAVFGAATNTFLAPLLIGGEVFGWANLPAFFVVCAAAYLFNMGKTIYAGQLPG